MLPCSSGRVAKDLLTISGHDLFGDEYQGLDFAQKLSTAKEAKLPRIVGSSMMIFYLTFTPMPISCPKQARMLFGLIFAGMTLARLAMYELYPEYLDSLTKELHSQLKLHLPYWTIFSAGNLLTFCQVSLSLGFLIYFSLVRITREGLVTELNQLHNSPTKPSETEIQTCIQKLVLRYTSLAEVFRQRERSPKIVGGALIVAGILFPALMFYEEWNRRTTA